MPELSTSFQPEEIGSSSKCLKCEENALSLSRQTKTIQYIAGESLLVKPCKLSGGPTDGPVILLSVVCLPAEKETGGTLAPSPLGGRDTSPATTWPPRTPYRLKSTTQEQRPPLSFASDHTLNPSESAVSS